MDLTFHPVRRQTLGTTLPVRTRLYDFPDHGGHLGQHVGEPESPLVRRQVTAVVGAGPEPGENERENTVRETGETNTRQKIANGDRKAIRHKGMEIETPS